MHAAAPFSGHNRGLTWRSRLGFRAACGALIFRKRRTFIIKAELAKSKATAFLASKTGMLSSVRSVCCRRAETC